MGDPDTSIPFNDHADGEEVVSIPGERGTNTDSRPVRTKLSESGPIVVVGPCASGKTTLVNELRRLGYDARVVAQEHSDIHDLWQHPDPSLVIALDVDLETLRRRRSKPHWPESLYRTQRRRLEAAMSVAAARLDTSSLSPMAVLAAATSTIREAGIRPCLPRTGQPDG